MWWIPQVLRASGRFAGSIVAHVRQQIEPSKIIPYELNKVDLVFAVSRHIHRSLEAGKVSPRQVKLLHSGLELERFSTNENGHEIRQALGLSPDSVVLGTVASLFPRKGYDVMIQAIPVIIKRVPHVHYLIIGSGEDAYEQQLRRQVERLCLDEHVHFLSFQQDVVPYLAALDVYVQPSRMEGLGIALLEAMAMKKPVVATDVGGLSEAVLHSYTGLLVEPDDAQALALAVLSLLSDPDRSRILGERARQRIETHFSVETMMDGLAQRYRDVLQTA